MKARIQRSWAKVKTLVLATSVTCRVNPLLAVGGGQTPERALTGAAAGQFEREAKRAFHASPRVDRRLDRDFLGRPFPCESARAHVQVFVVFADDDHVDVVGPLASDRPLDAREKLDRPEVDVLLELEPEPEQNPFFQDSRERPWDGRRPRAGSRRRRGALASRRPGRISPVRR